MGCWESTGVLSLMLGLFNKTAETQVSPSVADELCHETGTQAAVGTVTASSRHADRKRELQIQT